MGALELLQQVVPILRGHRAGADQFQHQPKVCIQPPSEDGLLFLGDHGGNRHPVK